MAQMDLGTYMMRTTSRHLSQLLPPPQRSIKRITLPLRTLILPIRRPLMRQTPPQLLHKTLPRIQPLQQRLSLLAPEDAAMLLPRAAHTTDAAHGHGHSLCQAVEHEIQRLHPQGDGGVDFAGGGPDVDAFVDAIFGAEVAVEVDFCFGDDFEV